MNRILICLLFCTSISLISCQNTQKQEVTSIVKEWSGKEIKLPSDLTFTRYGGDTTTLSYADADYKVLLYIDSLGCTSCRLKLSGWKALIKEVEALPERKVRFLFILSPSNVKELTYMLRREEFSYPVCLDTQNRMNRLNRFPSNQSYQCFLIDRNNRVVYIGNPVDNTLVKGEYMDIITGKKRVVRKDAPPTATEISQNTIQLGRLKTGRDTTFSISIKNTGNSPLSIYDIQVTCGCISVKYSHKPVKPGSAAQIGITYRADKPGTFRRTVSVSSNSRSGPITLTVQGEVK